MAEAREQDTGMDMIPGYERPTRSAVVDTAEQNVTPLICHHILIRNSVYELHFAQRCLIQLVVIKTIYFII